jgi:hypothetical protein
MTPRPDLPDAADLDLPISHYLAESPDADDADDYPTQFPGLAEMNLVQVLRLAEGIKADPKGEGEEIVAARLAALVAELVYLWDEDERRVRSRLRDQWGRKRRGVATDMLRSYAARSYSDDAAKAKFGGVRGSSPSKAGPSRPIQEYDAVRRALAGLKVWDFRAHFYVSQLMRPKPNPDAAVQWYEAADIARETGRPERSVREWIREGMNFLADILIEGECPV